MLIHKKSNSRGFPDLRPTRFYEPSVVTAPVFFRILPYVILCQHLIFHVFNFLKQSKSTFTKTLMINNYYSDNEPFKER